MENLENYKLISELNFGSVVRITYTDVEVENVEAEEGFTKENITREYIVTNVGPVIKEGEPKKVFLTDLDDGTLVMIDEDVEVFVVEER